MSITGKSLVLASVMCACHPEPPDLAEIEPTGQAGLPGSRVIGPEGGRLTVGQVALDVPPGALSGRVRISIVPVQPGGPADPDDKKSPRVPTVPAVMWPVRIAPVDTELYMPVTISISTPAALSQVAVVQAQALATQDLAWQPLPGQDSSPGLLWARSMHLGLFSLAPVSCCPSTDNVVCTVSCDVGPLHFRCADVMVSPACCDPYATTPDVGPTPLCSVPDLTR